MRAAACLECPHVRRESCSAAGDTLQGSLAAFTCTCAAALLQPLPLHPLPFGSPHHLPPAHAQVREALGHKVSRERVGTELDGMFNGEAGVWRRGWGFQGGGNGFRWPLQPRLLTMQRPVSSASLSIRHALLHSTAEGPHPALCVA